MKNILVQFSIHPFLGYLKSASNLYSQRPSTLMVLTLIFLGWYTEAAFLQMRCVQWHPKTSALASLEQTVFHWPAQNRLQQTLNKLQLVWVFFFCFVCFVSSVLDWPLQFSALLIVFMGKTVPACSIFIFVSTLQHCKTIPLGYKNQKQTPDIYFPFFNRHRIILFF